MSGPRGWVAAALAWGALARLAAGAEECILTQPLDRTPIGAAAAFSLACPGGPGPVAWDFGDGSRLDSSNAQVTHAYAAPGHYLVVARARAFPYLATLPHAAYPPVTALRPTHSSSVAYDATRRRVYVVNSDQNTVAAVDAAALRLLWERPVGKGPRALALDLQGNVWVTCQEDASLNVLAGDDGRALAALPLPYASRPFGIAFVPGLDRALVALEATGRLLEVDAERRIIVDSLDLGLRARALAVSADGRIFVGRFISPSDHGEVAEVSRAPLARRAVIALALDPGPDNEANSRGVPNALNAIAITPDGAWAWVASKKDNVQRGRYRENLDLTFETSVRSITSQIALATGREALARRKDYNDQSLASALAFTRLGEYAFVAQASSNNVAVVDAWSGGDVFSLEATGPEGERAPDGLALDDKDSLLFVRYSLSRELGVWDVSQVGQDNARVHKAASIPTIAQETLAPDVLRGKRLFANASDPRMCKDRYTSCEVCHMDGGSDGRVWDFTQRGEGLRRTTSLLGKAGTGQGPVHWSANFDEIQDFEHDMRGPFAGTGFMSDADFHSGDRDKTLGGKKAGLNPDLDALAAYVTSLGVFHPSPYRNPDGTLTADGAAGKAIFFRADVGCARCHAGPAFTDSRLPGPGASAALDPGDHLTPEGFLVHDVGTLGPGSGNRLADTLLGFDTPTLKGIWEFPPYLHDGSAATLADVVGPANAGDRHGHTSRLSAREKEQLVAYLLQIDDHESDALGVRHNMSGPAARTALPRHWREGIGFPRPGGSAARYDARGQRRPAWDKPPTPRIAP